VLLVAQAPIAECVQGQDSKEKEKQPDFIVKPAPQNIPFIWGNVSKNTIP